MLCLVVIFSSSLEFLTSNKFMFYIFIATVGSSVSSLSGLYTTAMKAAGASRRVFQLLDRVSTMPSSGDKCPLGSVQLFLPLLLSLPAKIS